MPELSFSVESAAPIRRAASPMMGFRVFLRQSGEEPVPIHSIILRAQVRIEPARRKYTPPEQDRLVDLFGGPERWGQTVRDILWAQVSSAVAGFVGETVEELQVPCGFDFTLAVTKYLDALETGDVPLCFLFSGTIFHESGGGLRVAQIPWDREARFRLPVAVWKELIARYYPDVAWLALRKDVFDNLHRFKQLRGLPTWEQAIEDLLATTENQRAIPKEGASCRN